MDEQSWPITIEAVATRFGCGVRWLKGHAREVGIGRRAGKKIIFDEGEYAALYRSLPGVGSEGTRASRWSAVSTPSKGRLSKKLQKPKPSPKPRAGRRGKRDYMKGAPLPLPVVGEEIITSDEFPA